LSEGGSAGHDEPIGVVRIIARLNVGGPAIQAITLTRRLRERGYATTLVRGREGPDEGNMDHLAASMGVQPVLIASMRRDPSWRDLPALLSLIALIRRGRPQIVHTHAAKAGTLGRVAALLARPCGRGRPVLIHTYHGHSLSGYFSPRTAAIYRRIETVLARRSDRLIAVSVEVRDELVSMGVAPRDEFEVVPLGFDLSPFAIDEPARRAAREALRAELGIPPDAQLVTLVARLVPIKRVDRFLRLANALAQLPGADPRFLVVGDGELRDELRRSPDAVALGERLTWAGLRQDMPSVCFASDVVVQTSDNEGTPVSLIEAQAAGVPVVSTRVGGAASVVAPEQLVPPGDADALAAKVAELLIDRDKASAAASAGAAAVRERFTLERLLGDVDGLYREALAARAARAARGVRA
jgi:glycosyltransferase involved in cell wall biosynthesis